MVAQGERRENAAVRTPAVLRVRRIAALRDLGPVGDPVAVRVGLARIRPPLALLAVRESVAVKVFVRPGVLDGAVDVWDKRIKTKVGVAALPAVIQTVVVRVGLERIGPQFRLAAVRESVVVRIGVGGETGIGGIVGDARIHAVFRLPAVAQAVAVGVGAAGIRAPRLFDGVWNAVVVVIGPVIAESVGSGHGEERGRRNRVRATWQTVGHHEQHLDAAPRAREAANASEWMLNE